GPRWAYVTVCLRGLDRVASGRIPQWRTIGGSRCGRSGKRLYATLCGRQGVVEPLGEERDLIRCEPSRRGAALRRQEREPAVGLAPPSGLTVQESLGEQAAAVALSHLARDAEAGGEWPGADERTVGAVVQLEVFEPHQFLGGRERATRLHDVCGGVREARRAACGPLACGRMLPV